MSTAVIMVSYNSENYLASSLRSLVERNLVFLVDNASDDQSAAIGRECGATVIELGSNVGFGKAANIGAERVPSEIDHLLFLNPDAQISASAVIELETALYADPQLGMVAPRLCFPDGADQLSARDFPSLRELMARWHQGFKVNSATNTERPDWVIGAAFMMRRVDFLSISGFRRSFFMYGEDVDLCWRLRARGFSIGMLPEVVASHDYGRGSREKLDLTNRLVRHHWVSIFRLACLYPSDFFRW